MQGQFCPVLQINLLIMNETRTCNIMLTSITFADRYYWDFPLVEQEFSEFGESDKSLKHEMGSIKHPVCHMCLSGAVVASRSLTQEVAGLSPFTTMTNILSLSSVKKFRENSNMNSIQ